LWLAEFFFFFLLRDIMGNLCSGSSDSGSSQPTRQKTTLLSHDDGARYAGASMIVETIPSEVKILCLGAGESGKSTFRRQMRFLYNNSKSKDSEDDKRRIKQQIHSDMITGMRALIMLAKNSSCCEKIGMQLEPGSLESAETLDVALPKKNGCYDLTIELGNCIQQLWKDPAIRACWKDRVELWPFLGVTNALSEEMYDSLEEYYDSTPRIQEDTYQPLHIDMIKCRVKTTGVEETLITVDGTSIRLLDVGGQKNERRKWINFFDNCKVLLFFAPLSDYELQLAEDPTVNRMHDSLALFDQMCNSHFFKDSIILLLLNKDDIFRERIRVKDLTCCFPDYTGGKDYDRAGDFIKQKFLAVNKNPKKRIYSNMTNATDTASMKVVFDSLQVLLSSSGN
jgi:guanine nucleotide-binding protein G(i) subunit alpha